MIDEILRAFADLFDNDAVLMSLAAAMLCLSAAGFLVYKIQQGRTDVARRIGGPAAPAEAAAPPPLKTQSRLSSLAARFVNKDGAPGGGDRKVLRHRLVQAGFWDASAAMWFVAARLACVPVFAVAGYFLIPLVFADPTPNFLGLGCCAAALIGYLAPSFALDKRIGRRREEHRDGFPDFMDLMVVCCQAGLRMEAAINRVARELGVAYPSLARNLELGAMELRGGKALGKAIESLAKRLGIEEAGSFATLLQQSEELGSSLTQSLRAYSDDMRNKRLMKAEEKAHALPAKLVIPLTLFVFPVIMVVIMLPVVIGVSAVWS